MATINDVRERLVGKPGAGESYPFGPGAAVFKVDGKVFAIVDDAGARVSLKGDPDDNIALRQMFSAVTPGYHLNKKHWNTVLPAEVPDDEVAAMIDVSYGLIVASLTRVARQRLLRLAAVAFDVIDPESPEAVAALQAYFAELDRRFTAGFDPRDAITADAPGFRGPSGAFVVARAGGDVAGCGGLIRIDEQTCEIKRMWISPQWRGCGLGRWTLRQLEHRAGRLGYARVILDTNSVLTEAIAMYRSEGYTDIDRYNDNPYAFHWFAKDLVPPS